MAARKHRPYLTKPEEFSYWKKALATTGSGVEMLNYASPQARELWYYLRSLGHVKHPPRWRHEHHGEDGFILHLVRRGALWLEVEGQRRVVRRGEACLLDLRCDVRYGVEGAGTAEFYWALFNGRDMPRVCLDLNADQDPVFRLRDPNLVGIILRELQDITTREPAAYEVRSSGLLTLVLAELFACRAGRAFFLPSGQTSRPLSDPVRRGLDYITRHYDKPIRVKQVADVHSLHYFSRRFHQEVGMSPIAYLNRYRIEQAKKHLTSSNHSVAEIARSVGIPDQRYFARLFVRIVGVTPLAYRKKPEKTRRSR